MTYADALRDLDDMLARIREMLADCPPANVYGRRNNDSRMQA